MNKQCKGEVALKDLEALRDELKVQAHLFSSELKKQWEHVEKDWQTLRSETERLRPAAAKIEESLLRIRDELKRHHAR